MANMKKTIKGSTDQELTEILDRLRKENEVQMLIADLNRRSKVWPPPGNEGQSSFVPDPPLSTEVPIDSMYHIGIMGMKWGKRKSEGSTSEEHTTSRAIQKKSVMSMTNKELKAYNERIQLETTYRSLNPTKVQKGLKLVKGVMSNAKTIIEVYAMMNSPVGLGIRKKMGLKVSVPKVDISKAAAECKAIFDKAIAKSKNVGGAGI